MHYKTDHTLISGCFFTLTLIYPGPYFQDIFHYPDVILSAPPSGPTNPSLPSVLSGIIKMILSTDVITIHPYPFLLSVISE